MSNDFYASILSGGFISTIFNPYDYALYLSMTKKRKFLTMDNFREPFKGYGQAVFHRTVQSGTYFYLQSNVKDHVNKFISPNSINNAIASGIAIGSLNGTVCHILSAVKLNMWSDTSANSTFLSTVKHMHTNHGYRGFTKAIHITVMRDGFLFGTIYEIGRFAGNNSFIINMLSAGIGTTVASPVNYCRNMKFSNNNISHNDPKYSVINILKGLKHDIVNHEKPFYHLCSRLCIGWGTLRVAVGMALNQALFDYLLTKF